MGQARSLREICQLTDSDKIGELTRRDKILFGREENAGLSIREHVPEKDGVLAGRLCCDIVARCGKSLRSQLDEAFAEVGSYYPLRDNFRLTAEVRAKFTEKLRSDSSKFYGSRVAQAVTTDGLKLVLADGSWFATAFGHDGCGVRV